MSERLEEMISTLNIKEELLFFLHPNDWQKKIA